MSLKTNKKVSESALENANIKQNLDVFPNLNSIHLIKFNTTNINQSYYPMIRLKD